MEEYKPEIFNTVKDAFEPDRAHAALNPSIGQMMRSLKSLLSTHDGKMLLSYILDCTDCFNNAANFDNPNATYYLLGQRSIGQKLFYNMSAIDPGAFGVITKFNKENNIKWR